MTRTTQICALILIQLLIIACPLSIAADNTQLARNILSSTNTKGGLIVHLNCTDGQLTSALRTSDAYLVHGLTLNPSGLTQARKNITGKGLYGPVSVDLLEAKTLPYIDNSVNLIVIDGTPFPTQSEILRVLAPRGSAYIRKEGEPGIITKPWPDTIDEWTHYLHDSSNNAVAHDTEVAPPRHLQWDAAPTYSRHHEFTSSVAAVVSAQGRIFTIMDLASRASIHMPPDWQLIARDAFNGVKLWQRPIDSWFNHLWPLKDGPAQPPRRLVAVGDYVYVTLSLEAPVSRLDAATGKLVKTYTGTEFTEEILYNDGVLFLLKNNKSMNPADYNPELMVCWDEKNRTMKDSEGWLLKPENRNIIAIDANTGNQLFNVVHKAEPLTLAADDKNVYFHNWNRIVCLDRKTGKQKWQTKPVAPRESMGYVYGPTLVAYGDVVLFADGRQQRHIHAFSKSDGSFLWQGRHYAGGHSGSAEDLMVADGLVWCGKIAGGGDSGVLTGRDPKTGKVVREFTPDVKTYWFHHRCYRAKATDKYFLASRTGTEFIDLREQTWDVNHWIRGACTYGVMPCNGLLYAPPSPCACYLESKLHGFTAAAPSSQRTAIKPLAPDQRLQKGPAYGQPLAKKTNSANQWPTYRHDPKRSGTTKTKINLPLSNKWQTDLGPNLTSPVIADNRLLIASKDTHTLFALNADTGQNLWQFTTGAKIDSPPTIYRGLAIFGSADGRVYCLRASDGTLVWRFSAAPYDRRLVSCDKLESVWPVHGSVLVKDAKVYCVAGRSTYLDGGLRLISLDAATGKLLTEKIIDDQSNPQKDVKVLNMPTAQPDILSAQDDLIFMRSQAFKPDGTKVTTVDPTLEPFERSTKQLGPGAHLFSPTGFLDDDAWHRSYWVYGRAFSSGCNWWYRAGRYAPAGRMMVFDDEKIYGFGRQPGLFVWSHVLENHIFCSDTESSPEAIERVRAWSKKSGRSAIFNRSFTREAVVKDHLAPNLHWSVKQPPLHTRAMVLAADTLFVAGPADVLNEDEAFQTPFNPDTKEKINAQNQAYQGKRPALLLAISSKDGKTLQQQNLPSPPVWDGIAAANGNLYIATKDGKITCLNTSSVAKLK